MLEPAIREDLLPGVLRVAMAYTNLSHDITGLLLWQLARHWPGYELLGLCLRELR